MDTSYGVLIAWIMVATSRGVKRVVVMRARSVSRGEARAEAMDFVRDNPHLNGANVRFEWQAHPEAVTA